MPAVSHVCVFCRMRWIRDACRYPVALAPSPQHSFLRVGDAEARWTALHARLAEAFTARGTEAGSVLSPHVFDAPEGTTPAVYAVAGAGAGRDVDGAEERKGEEGGLIESKSGEGEVRLLLPRPPPSPV
jgi:hypothetical protein